MDHLNQRNTQSSMISMYKPFIKSVSMFSEFSDDALDEVIAHSFVRHVKKQDLIFTTCAKADVFWIIVHGWVKLYRQSRDGRDAVFSVLTNQEVFGKTSILNTGRFPYTAKAATDCELLAIHGTFMTHMADHHEDYDHFLTKFLKEELTENELLKIHSEQLMYMSSAQRVGCFLLRMCGDQTNGSINHDFPYEKSLIAERLGMSAETFSRALNQLGKIGVETNRANVTIQNIQQLGSFVCEVCSATKLECNMAGNSSGD